MGGAPAGPVMVHEHQLEPWEKRVDAILRLLLTKGVLTLDELRRGRARELTDSADVQSFEASSGLGSDAIELAHRQRPARSGACNRCAACPTHGK